MSLPSEPYPDLAAAVDAAQQRIAAQHDAALPGAALAATVTALVVAMGCVWQSNPAALGLTAQFGPSGGQWAVVIFGAIALALLGCARRWPRQGLIGTAVAADLLAAIVAISGFHSSWAVTGPGPWLAMAGFVFAAGLSTMWVRAIDRPRPA